MDRIVVGRELFVYEIGDYDQEENCHKLNQNESDKSRSRIPKDSKECMFYMRSRLNVVGCGTSMCKLRGKLKKLIKFGNVYFPTVVNCEEMKQRIELALSRSIKVCTEVKKDNTNNDYFDNFDDKSQQPSKWNEENRLKSIRIDIRKKSPKKINWKQLWAHKHEEYLLYELKFNVSQLHCHLQGNEHGRVAKQYLGSEILNEFLKILEIMNRMNVNLLRKFVETNKFKEEMDTEATFGTDLFGLLIVSMTIVLIEEADKVNSCLDKQVVENIIDGVMQHYFMVFETNLMRRYSPNRSIFNYLHPFPNWTKYFTEEIIGEFKKESSTVQMYLFTDVIIQSLYNDQAKRVLSNFDYSKMSKSDLWLAFKIAKRYDYLIEIVMFFRPTEEGGETVKWLCDFLGYYVQVFGLKTCHDYLDLERYVSLFQWNGLKSPFTLSEIEQVKLKKEQLLDMELEQIIRK